MSELRLEKHGKGWRYIFEGAKINGKRTRICKSGFLTKGEAAKAGAKALDLYNNTGEKFSPSEMSYSDFLGLWIRNYCQFSVKIGTTKNYAKKIRLYIDPYLGKFKIGTLNAQVLQEYINALALKKYSRNTLTVIKGILSGSLNYAEQQRLILYNPMHSVKLPSSRNERIKSRTQPHFYVCPEDMGKIFQRFPKGSPSYLPLQIGYRCGLRLGEVFGLTWDCVDIDKKTLKINKQVQWNEQSQHWYFTDPKYDSFRIIDLDEELCRILEDKYKLQQRAKEYYGDLYIQQYEDENRQININGGSEINLIMVREDGSYIQPRTMTHVAKVIHEDLRINYTFHSLRHTHATMLAENGASVKYVQYRLGHSDPNVTLKVYQHLTDSMKLKGNEVLNNSIIAIKNS